MIDEFILRVLFLGLITAWFSVAAACVWFEHRKIQIRQKQLERCEELHKQMEEVP